MTYRAWDLKTLDRAAVRELTHAIAEQRTEEMEYSAMDEEPWSEQKYAATLAAQQKETALLAGILAARGITDPADALTLLAGEEELTDPMLLTDMDKACARILQAIDQEETIVVFGDYDVDGVTATALLYQHLKGMGANVKCMLPSREALDQISLARGRQVSLLRRMLALFYDTVISLIAAAAATVFAGGRAFFWAIAAYFCVLPPLLSGRTPGMVWTRLRLCRKGGGIPYIYQYPVRFGLEFAALIGLPVALNVLAIRQYRGDNEAYLTLFLLMNGGYILALLFACVRALMHRPLFYERLSGTRLESTTENMNQ